MKTKTAARQPLTYNDMAAALGIVKGDDRAKMRLARSRLVALGYVQECSRCGGCGHYSYNQITGTVCFGCDGSGRELPRITPAILAEAVSRQAAGELDAYFAENKARGDAKRALGPIVATFDEEWSHGAVHTTYEAHYKTRIIGEDLHRAARLVNDLHSAMHVVVFVSTRGGFDAVAGVAKAQEILAMLREVNAAWASYEAGH